MQALRNLGVSIVTSTKVTGVQKAGVGAAAAAAAASAATAAVETAVSAAATAATAATGARAGGEGLPPRSQSPEAAAVEPLAVLAAAAAAATTTTTSTTTSSSTASPAGFQPNTGGSSSGNGGVSSSEEPLPSTSSTGEDATYLVQLEPVWAASSPEASSSSSSMSADLVLWTAGARPASTPLQPFLPLDARGQLETDPTLRVLRHARVFALGDVSRGQPGNDGSGSSSGFYPATAQVAFQQADYAAWNIWAAINGRPLLPFR